MFSWVSGFCGAEEALAVTTFVDFCWFMNKKGSNNCWAITICLF